VQITGSLGVIHGIIRLKEGEADAAEYVCRASVGYTDAYLKQLEAYGGFLPGLQGDDSGRLSCFPDLRTRRTPKSGPPWPMRVSPQLISVPLSREKSGVVGLLKCRAALPDKRFHEG